jgi:peptide/nickel transport system ATP-binding protein
VGLVGESGSGKTTLARLLVGLEHPSGGSITIDGIDAGDWGRLRPPDRRHLRGTPQVVFQDPYSSLNPVRSVGWTLREAVSIHEPAVRDRHRRVEELLEQVGLPVDYARRRPVALSGGERQRVAIARALAANPRVLVCDEPVSALDVSVRAQVLNLFLRLRRERGLGYLFITHDLSIVRQVTDVLYVVYRGRIVESGPTDEVLDHPKEPYTVQLLEAIPGGERTRRTA